MKSPSVSFNCPNCDARYELVRMEIETASGDEELICLSCGGPFPAREGRFVLKYFFVDTSGKRRNYALHGPRPKK